MSEKIAAEKKSITTSELVANLYNSPSAIVAQLGIAVLGYEVFRALATTEVSPFTGHPLFNSLGVVLLLQGVMVVQPPPKNPEIKTRLGYVHGVFNNLAASLFVLGSGFIFYNKAAYGASHYTTWHSWFGLTTYITLVTVALVGNCIYFFPNQVFGSVNKAKSFYKYHRQGGYLALILISTSIALATYSSYNQSTLHIPRGTVFVALAMIFGGLFARMDVKKMGF